MKKIIVFIVTLLVALFVYINVNADEVIIPDAAIRVRVIANSNSIYDQKMKMKVKRCVEEYFYPKLIDVNTIEEARVIINNNMDDLNIVIDKLFSDSNYDINYKINYGDNYFPSKEYRGVKYNEGEYESLVITIGRGEGDNWWCVLFPPLCLLEVDDNNTSDVEYRFFVKDIIDKIFE